MALFHSDWRPRWAFKGEPLLAIVFTTQDENGAAWERYGKEISLLTVKFLASRLEHASDEDLNSEASFLYVLVGRRPQEAEESLEVERDGVFVEFGFGEAPAAPAEWQSIPLRDLLGSAMRWLRGEW